MQGNHTLAGSHIQSGSKLLREIIYDHRNGVLRHPVLGSKSNKESYAPLEVLVGIFAGLDSQIAIVSGFDFAFVSSTTADAFRVVNGKLQVRAQRKFIL
jgi:hypothetical protein